MKNQALFSSNEFFLGALRVYLIMTLPFHERKCNKTADNWSGGRGDLYSKE